LGAPLTQRFGIFIDLKKGMVTWPPVPIVMLAE
jgi:hypothetical protein